MATSHPVSSYVLGDHIGDFEVLEIRSSCCSHSIYDVRVMGSKAKVRYTLKLWNSFNPNVRREVRYMMDLSDMDTGSFAHIVNYCKFEDYSYCVTQYLGKTLLEVFDKQKGRSFSFGCTGLVLRQTLTSIVALKKAGLVHGSISPSCFRIGAGDEVSKLYLSEYSSLRSEDSMYHIPRADIDLIYSSIGVMEGRRPIHKHDVESWMYMAIEMIVGRLPWSHLKRSDDILKCKKSFMGSKTDQESFVPSPFWSVFTEFSRILDGNYKGLLKCIEDLFKDEEIVCDWENDEKDHDKLSGDIGQNKHRVLNKTQKDELTDVVLAIRASQLEECMYRREYTQNVKDLREEVRGLKAVLGDLTLAFNSVP